MAEGTTSSYEPFMRIFATSDLHLHYEAHRRWLSALSALDYQEDLLLVAGDLSHDLRQIAQAFEALSRRFARVLFVPGNHDLWVIHDEGTSWDRLARLRGLAGEHGVEMGPFRELGLAIVPLLAWYDGSFGTPCPSLREQWMDWRACRWGMADPEVTRLFLAMNEPYLGIRSELLITVSHFVPRLDLFPDDYPENYRLLYPVLGCAGLEEQIRRLGPRIHLYGHSHLNRDVVRDGVRYVNLAFTGRRLHLLLEI